MDSSQPSPNHLPALEPNEITPSSDPISDKSTSCTLPTTLSTDSSSESLDLPLQTLTEVKSGSFHDLSASNEPVDIETPDTGAGSPHIETTEIDLDDDEIVDTSVPASTIPTAINTKKPFLDPSLSGTHTVRLGSSLSSPTVTFKIRDFGFPIESPNHYGHYNLASPTASNSSTSSDIENLFPCYARALYDFDAENPSELSFAEGDIISIQYRQYPGWLMAELNGKSGLVPENYVGMDTQ